MGVEITEPGTVVTGVSKKQFLGQLMSDRDVLDKQFSRGLALPAKPTFAAAATPQTNRLKKARRRPR